MNMHIETIPSCPIAYIRQTGAYGVQNIQTMEKLKHWAKANNLLNRKTVILGIAHDNPQTTPPENCRYDACLILADKPFPAGDNVEHGEFAGGKYAVFTVKHTPEAIEKAWAEIFVLLSAKGSLPDTTRPIMERYAAKQVERHLCEICVPIG
ncbi:DNA gyrase inhibitor [Desulfosporosinus orientis DSM 765]|uniref:DNA gyrase inhibitor n=1 Tax=Desulfosporosinus orientis (strain ATCC 19365 / DSM 765 / NCIMB 8382 / VKM B-1628 / Singapore I) TaxID=768706 RepID=G7WAZ4_DESOD|nr:GyrI-like domain-containing protein [Desulfosporosinus orientis]AET67495.1 DNA gyrase inhibitor [Desulfosporosinus orientis DSM 765]